MVKKKVTINGKTFMATVKKPKYPPLMPPEKLKKAMIKSGLSAKFAEVAAKKRKQKLDKLKKEKKKTKKKTKK